MDIAANAQAAEEPMVVRVKEWNQRQQARLEYEAKCASLCLVKKQQQKTTKKTKKLEHWQLEHQYRLDQEAREARVGDLDAELAEMLRASLRSPPRAIWPHCPR